MENTSVFAEYLQELADHCKAVDRADADRFIECQRLEGRIIRAYQAGYFHRVEYRALMNVYHIVMDGYREIEQHTAGGHQDGRVI